jgi:putative oxidoreductase
LAGRFGFIFFLARMALGFVFIYASMDKILNPADFARVIHAYRILPAGWVGPLALGLPWVELAIGLLLLLGRLVWPSALIAGGLLLGFSGAMGYDLARGFDFQCGCFSTAPDAQAAGLMTLVRDLALLVLVLLVLVEGFRRGLNRPAGSDRLARS